MSFIDGGDADDTFDDTTDVGLLDADVLAAIRAHVGSQPDEEDLAGRYARLESVDAVALEVLRGRLADMLARPADLSVDGDYSESWQVNVRALQTQIVQLERAVAAGGNAGVVTVTHLSRAGRSR